MSVGSPSGARAIQAQSGRSYRGPRDRLSGKVLHGGECYLMQSLDKAARSDFGVRAIANARLPDDAIVAVPLKNGVAVREDIPAPFEPLNRARAAVNGWEQRPSAMTTVRNGMQRGGTDFGMAAKEQGRF